MSSLLWENYKLYHSTLIQERVVKFLWKLIQIYCNNYFRKIWIYFGNNVYNVTKLTWVSILEQIFFNLFNIRWQPYFPLYVVLWDQLAPELYQLADLLVNTYLQHANLLSWWFFYFHYDILELTKILKYWFIKHNFLSLIVYFQYVLIVKIVKWYILKYTQSGFKE